MKGKKMLNTLYQEALDRKTNPKEGSYTNYLYTKGLDKILKKSEKNRQKLYSLQKMQIKMKFLKKLLICSTI